MEVQCLLEGDVTIVQMMSAYCTLSSLEGNYLLPLHVADTDNDSSVTYLPIGIFLLENISNSNLTA